MKIITYTLLFAVLGLIAGYLLYGIVGGVFIDPRHILAAPAAAPRRMSEVLRIIREPFRLRQPPTMGLDQREPRPYETRYKAPVGWNLSRG